MALPLSKVITKFLEGGEMEFFFEHLTVTF